MRWVIGLCMAVAMAGASRAAPPSAVAYRLTPVMDAGGLAALEVEIAFAGDADGETRLVLPDKWAGTAELWRQVHDLAVEGATVSDDGPAERRLRHAPGQALKVRYRVRAAGDGEPGLEAAKAQPIVRPAWFYAHGEGLFAVPEGRETAKASFEWGPLPAGWTVASDLDHLASSRPGTVEDVVESISIGAPDLKVLTRQVNGDPLRVAVRGAWPFAPEALAALVVRIVQGSEDFWGGGGRPYLLTVGPLAGGVGGRSSMNGTGRSDAFAVLGTTNIDLTNDAFFLSHEFQHTWIARLLGGQPRTDEALEYWFSEGFTDHYASRNLLRAGVWSLADVLAKDNEILARYASSPAKAMTSAQIMPVFWTDQNAQQANYDRGRLLALVLDAQLSKASGGKLGLDEVILAQQHQAASNQAVGKVVTAGALFPQVYRRVGGIDAAETIDRHVVRGEPIVLPPGVYGPCVELQDVRMAAFDRGFDGEASARTGVVTGVDPAGPAYAAGLRDGMKRLGREGGKEGDSRVEIGYRVADASGAERLVRYRPEGKGTIRFQQLAVRPGLDARAEAACVQGILR